jgi:hypothetical protein
VLKYFLNKYSTCKTYKSFKNKVHYFVIIGYSRNKLLHIFFSPSWKTKLKDVFIFWISKLTTLSILSLFLQMKVGHKPALGNNKLLNVIQYTR